MGLFSRTTHDGVNDGYNNYDNTTGPVHHGVGGGYNDGLHNTHSNTMGSTNPGLDGIHHDTTTTTTHHGLPGTHHDNTMGSNRHGLGSDNYATTGTGHHGLGGAHHGATVGNTHHGLGTTHGNTFNSNQPGLSNTYNDATTTGHHGLGQNYNDTTNSHHRGLGNTYNGTTTTNHGLGGTRDNTLGSTHRNTVLSEKDHRVHDGSTHRGKLLSNKKTKTRSKRPMFDPNSGHYNRRPSFGQWLKFTWLDILTMIILGAIGLGVYEADPAPTRSFPVTFQDGEIVYPQFAYPLRREIIPIWAAALLGSLIPIFFFLVMQIRIKSFWDVNNAVIGLLYSLITAAVFQVFVKWLIGGLRPHFLSVCQPDVSRVEQGGDGFRSVMFTADICTGDRNQINDSLESMPSGHSTAAFAGLIFLYLYLNAKLKVFSNHHPAMWKLVAVYAPVLGACLIAGALTIDEFHNWYDCLAGAVIGTVMAFSAYRMVYASVWDFRFNHIPLTRHTPFSYGAGGAGAAGFESAVFTHAAGWGHEEAYGGAPFDAAHHLRGQHGASAFGDHTSTHRGRSSGHYHPGDPEYNAAGLNTTTDNRYRTHRKSLERKAVPVGTRTDGAY